MRLATAILLVALAPGASAQGSAGPGAKPVAAPMTRPGTVESIGPKQDDPRTSGIIVQGGLVPDCTGGEPTRRGALAIGPKQDDPRSPAAVLARPGDDNDPKASGAGVEAIGPKQDDPRASGIIVQGGLQPVAGARRGVLAIGPKQDDPRSPTGAAMRPGDDEDPKARCVPQGR